MHILARSGQQPLIADGFDKTRLSAVVKKFRRHLLGVVDIHSVCGVTLHRTNAQPALGDGKPFLVGCCHYGLNQIMVK